MRTKRPTINRDAVRRSAFAHLPDVEIDGDLYPDYVGMADGYVDAVLSGRVIENRFVVLACQRYRAMRKAAAGGKADYGWYPEFVFECAAFVEACTGGELGEEAFTVEPMQCWLIANLVGFRVADARGSYRWFTEFLFDSPRASGKSGLFARIDIYLFLYEHENASQVLLAASSRPQALKVYRPIKNVLLAERELVEQHKLTVTSRIIRKPDGGFIETMSAIGKKEDGAIPHIVHVDELHAVNDALFEVIGSSFGKRRSELLIQTTTAGVSVTGPAYKQRKRLESVLNGVQKAPRFFGVIYTIDEEDMKDPLRWENVVKAHPMLGVTLKASTVEDDLEAARFNPGKRGEFLAKRLNVYTRGATHAIAPTEWAQCEDKALAATGADGKRASVQAVLAPFRGRKAFVGGDLSSHDDQTSVGVIIEDEIPICLAWHFVPDTAPGFQDDALADDLMSWVEAGWLTVTDAGVIDFEAVQALVEEICGILDVEAVVFDRAHSVQMVVNLKKKGIVAGNIGATSVEMSEPTKDLVIRARNKQLRHDGNPVLAWNAANMVINGGTHVELWRPAKDKTKPQFKIDGISALCHANVARLGRLQVKDAKEETPFDPMRIVRRL